MSNFKGQLSSVECLLSFNHSVRCFHILHLIFPFTTTLQGIGSQPWVIPSSLYHKETSAMSSDIYFVVVTEVGEWTKFGLWDLTLELELVQSNYTSGMGCSLDLSSGDPAIAQQPTHTTLLINSMLHRDDLVWWGYSFTLTPLTPFAASHHCTLTPNNIIWMSILTGNFMRLWKR